MGKVGRPRTAGTAQDRNRMLRHIDRKPIRPLERQRMRPWIIDLLDRGVCQQMSWLAKRKMEFRVSWKHAAGQSWEPDADASLFELWARHTGKFYHGDKPNPKKWKANFRCALNSLRDVEQDRGQGIKRGTNAFKVYRFLDYKKSKTEPIIKEEPIDDYECYGARNRGTRSRPRVPTMVEPSNDGAEEQMDVYEDPRSHPTVTAPGSDGETAHDDVQELNTSPLPNFEQLCFSCPTITKIERVSPVIELPYTCRPQDSHTPQTDFSDEDDLSTTSSAPTDEEVVNMLLEPYYTNQLCGPLCDEYYTIQSDYVQEWPEEIVASDGYLGLEECDGPKVVVMQTDGEFNNCTEFVYAGIDDM